MTSKHNALVEKFCGVDNIALIVHEAPSVETFQGIMPIQQIIVHSLEDGLNYLRKV